LRWHETRLFERACPRPFRYSEGARRFPYSDKDEEAISTILFMPILDDLIHEERRRGWSANHAWARHVAA